MGRLRQRDEAGRTVIMVIRKLGAVLVVGCLLAGAMPREEGPPAPEWRLVWSDEFDKTEIDTARWNFDTGNGFHSPDAKAWISGWGNDELQYYPRRPENVFVRDNALHIRAMKEPYEGCGYT